MTFNHQFSTSQKWMFAVATAILWWAAGLRWHLFFLGWIAFVPLFVMCARLPLWQRFKWGYITGWLSYCLINWWIVLSIARGAPAIGASVYSGAILGVISVALIGIIHGIGVAIISVLWRRRIQDSPALIFAMPFLIAAVWWGLEWLRAQSAIAHTWGALAYTQWSNLYSLQVASVIGRNGLSAWCVWISAMIALAIVLRPQRSRAFLASGLAVFGLFALHTWGAFLYYQPEKISNTSLKVLLVQTASPGINITFEDNTPFEQASELTEKYFSKNHADLVVWPESTFGLGQGDFNSMKNEEWIRDFCQTHKTSLLTGTKRWNPDGHLYNDASLFSPSPDSEIQGNAKKWLVPFGERAPFGDTLPFLKRFEPQPPLEPATSKIPLQLQDGTESITLGTLVCFDSAFAAPFQQLRQRGSQLFAIVTNDSWFEGSEAPWAHATMSALAAVENRTVVVQAANAGYNFAIDRKGRFLAKSTFGTPQITDVTINLNLPQEPEPQQEQFRNIARLFKGDWAVALK